MEANVRRIEPDLHLISLYPPLSGFTDFIGAWLYQGKTSFLVDVGPASTVAGLIKRLRDLNVTHLDYILLTHIHLDHCGGIGAIAGHFPQTPIVCHKDGIPHLIDPTRLWEGTQRILGATALGYGPVTAVSGHRLVAAQEFSTAEVVPVITPGHAAHHVSYRTSQYIFAGEAGGVFLALPDSREYLRPATPPRFFLDTALKSIDALIAGQPSKICYGHYGLRNAAVEMLAKHREQLVRWERLIQDVTARTAPDDILAACLDRVLKEDPCLDALYQMPLAVREREMGFLQNSIKGFVGYLKER
ncbi:MAG: MBL fold metallo-hydrolase [Desulfobacterales bacterium]|nr:MAG: MBL fold metallo-hydrolase [Desulfobacterales bacterium]